MSDFDTSDAGPAEGPGRPYEPARRRQETEAPEVVAYINHDPGAFGFMGEAPEPAHDYLSWAADTYSGGSDPKADERKLVRLSDVRILIANLQSRARAA